MSTNLLLVGFGGGIGSMARWMIQRTIATYFPHSFPIGTFAVNIVGCFLIGILWAISSRSQSFTEGWQNFLMAGLCGGFTTFSAITLESMLLLKDNKEWIFLAYVGGSMLIGLLATYAGITISR